MSEKKLNKKEKFAATARAKESNVSASPLKNDYPKWWAWLPAILGFLVYANTLNFGFVLDDYAAIIENTSTQKGMSALGEIFSTSYRYGYILMADELYRPLPKAIFAIFWDLFPNNATPGHLLNVLLFAFTCYFIFRLLSKWFPEQQKLAFLTALIFAVHPIHTEVVANIKSLDEILSFLLCLLSLDQYLTYKEKSKMSSIILAMILFFVAFLSKESTITFLPIFPLLVYFRNNTIDQAGLKSSLYGTQWMLIPTLIFLLIRYKIINNSDVFSSAPPSVADNALMYAKDSLTQLTGAVAMLGFYLYKLVVPINLSFDLSYPEVTPAGISDWKFILSAVVLLFLLGWAIKGMKNRNPTSLALFFFFITVAVSSNIFMRIGTHYGERLMYVPSFGMVLLLSWLILKFLDAKESVSKTFSSPALFVSGAIVLIFSGLTIARNPVWKSNESLYNSGLISAPNSARVHYYVGLYKVKTDYLQTLSEKDRDAVFNDGVVHLKKSIELYPFFTDAWTQLGIASYRVKNYPEALKYYDEAIKLNPYDPVVLNNSGSVYFDMQNYNEALKRYQQAVKNKPDYADAYMNIGSCYGVGGQYDLAITNLERAVQINPNLTQAYYFLGVTWRNKGNEAMAAKYFELANSVSK
ncbi:MAG: tetratricopeptide repeat protein [Bacteroidetes bacterium]|nr:tetratricopeptide repeat protein [Bacteroidota bacterium]